MTDPDDIRLESALRDLGTRLDVPPRPDVTAAVRARLVVTPVRRTRWRRWAAAAATALIAFVTAFTVSPAVRATVEHLLSFAGVELRQEPAPPPGLQAPLPGERTVDLAEARRLAAFPVLVPAALGPPDEVRVSDGRPPRVVSLIYRPGVGRPASGPEGIAVRVDEFDGRIGPVFEKFVAMSGGERVRVGAGEGVWIPGPHEVLYVDRSGEWRTETARLAARTLIWQQDDVTFRLEGQSTVDEALHIAGTVR